MFSTFPSPRHDVILGSIPVGQITGFCWAYMGIMEEKTMETTIIPVPDSQDSALTPRCKISKTESPDPVP